MTVIVEWTQGEDVLYNVTVIPMVPVIAIWSTIIELMLSYNIQYNVSLEALGVCQGSHNIQLFYGELIPVSRQSQLVPCMPKLSTALQLIVDFIVKFSSQLSTIPDQIWCTVVYR